MKEMLNEQCLNFFHGAHLVNEMLDPMQSTSSVANYINSFEELTQHCDLVKDLSTTIARFS